MSKKPFPKGSVEHRLERRRFLTQLVHEYSRTNSREAKQQVLANLANFAYDPYNHELFKELSIISIFMYEVGNGKNAKLVEFAMGALCNCSPDERFKQDIIDGGGIRPIISNGLSSGNANTIVSALGTLLNVITPLNRHELITQDLLSKAQELSQHQDLRIRNLANIFCDDHRSLYSNVTV